MTTQLAITPRNLGSLTLEKYCPSCLWYLLRMRFHPPFDNFGAGIFSAMERSEKAIIGHFLESKKGLPGEFAPFCDLTERIEYPTHWSKFRYLHETGVVLYGACDDIFKQKDGRLCVCDHKTAKNKGGEDPYHSQYEIQVIGYSNIAQIGLELGEVARGVLMYWEVQTDDLLENPAGYYENKTLCVPFKVSPVEVAMDYSVLNPLLKELKKVWRATNPPERREGCKDCKKLDLLFALEQEMEALDAKILRFATYRDSRNEVISRGLRRRNRRELVLQELFDAGELKFANESITANWEFPTTSDFQGLS